jgi:hypothetical protein
MESITTVYWVGTTKDSTILATSRQGIHTQQPILLKCTINSASKKQVVMKQSLREGGGPNTTHSHSEKCDTVMSVLLINYSFSVAISRAASQRIKIKIKLKTFG